MGGTSTTLNYTENGAATAIAPSGTVTDVDSADFNGGSLTVAFTANGTTADQLTIQNQGTGAGQIGVSGSNVTFGGVTIGTFSGGTNGSALVINFNSAAATPAVVQALSEAILYSNSSDNPSTLARTVTFTVVDGDGTANGGGDTGSAAATINVTATNDGPVISNLSVSGSTISFIATDPDNTTLSLAAPFAAAFGNPTITSGATTNLNPTQQPSAVSGTLQVTDGSATADVVGLFLGTSAGNSFTAGASDTAIYGFDGNDTLTGGSGADWIFGGNNDDTIVGAQNDTLLDGGANTDTLQVGANFTSSSDAQIANIENVTLTAAVALNLANQTEGFTITGSSGADSITAGSGSTTPLSARRTTRCSMAALAPTPCRWGRTSPAAAMRRSPTSRT